MSTSSAATGNAKSGNASSGACLSKERNAEAAFLLFVWQTRKFYETCKEQLTPGAKIAENDAALEKLVLEYWNNAMTNRGAKPYLRLAAKLKPEYAKGDGAAAKFLYVNEAKKLYTGKDPDMPRQMASLAGILWLCAPKAEKKPYVDLAAKLKGKFEDPSSCRVVRVPGKPCSCSAQQ